MSLVAMVVFFASLVGIISLFTLKRIELHRNARFAESLRMHADHGALRVKAWIETSEWYLEKMPWFIAALARYAVRVGALGFARLARTSAEQAHRLADFVSHRRNFERRETKSQFLKDVSDYKNGKGNDDTPVATL